MTLARVSNFTGPQFTHLGGKDRNLPWSCPPPVRLQRDNSRVALRDVPASSRPGSGSGSLRPCRTGPGYAPGRVGTHGSGRISTLHLLPRAPGGSRRRLGRRRRPQAAGPSLPPPSAPRPPSWPPWLGALPPRPLPLLSGPALARRTLPRLLAGPRARRPAPAARQPGTCSPSLGPALSGEERLEEAPVAACGPRPGEEAGRRGDSLLRTFTKRRCEGHGIERLGRTVSVFVSFIDQLID